MGREIERKFLVDPARWQAGSIPGVRIRQGYLSLDPRRIVRVRRADAAGTLTLKGPTHGIERTEFEYPIPAAEADDLLDRLCHRPLIEKVRYAVPYQGRTWEVDVFDGDNRGLVVAEVELESVDAEVRRPPWVTREVSDDPRYFNAGLIQHPFSQWRDDG